MNTLLFINREVMYWAAVNADYLYKQSYDGLDTCPGYTSTLVYRLLGTGTSCPTRLHRKIRTKEWMNAWIVHWVHFTFAIKSVYCYMNAKVRKLLSTVMDGCLSVSLSKKEYSIMRFNLLHQSLCTRVSPENCEIRKLIWQTVKF